MTRKRTKSHARSVKAADAAIGERIRATRLAMGISQENLAEAIGVTFQQVQKYEKGVNRVAASTLLDISEALRAPIHTLLPSVAPPREGSAARGAEELAMLYEKMNDAGRKLLLDTARTFDIHTNVRRPRSKD